MSAGFEFAKKHEITICGRAYPCDISDKRMLEGVTRDFPRVLQAAQAFCAMDAKLKPGGQDGRSADTMAQEALKKFSHAVSMCRTFIEARWALKNTGRSSAAARRTSTNTSACARTFTARSWEDAGRSWSSS